MLPNAPKGKPWESVRAMPIARLNAVYQKCLPARSWWQVPCKERLRERSVCERAKRTQYGLITKLLPPHVLSGSHVCDAVVTAGCEAVFEERCIATHTSQVQHSQYSTAPGTGGCRLVDDGGTRGGKAAPRPLHESCHGQPRWQGRYILLQYIDTSHVESGGKGGIEPAV